jgi:hypothetical protein
MRAAFVLVLLFWASPAQAQETVPKDSYRDEGARELVRLARDRRSTVDTRITAYQTTVRKRFSFRIGLGAGLDRLVLRRELAARIDWTADTVRIEVLGAREAQPLVSTAAELPPPDVARWMPALAFDPSDAEMLLRLDSTDIHHPLATGSEKNFRFSSGDTAVVRLADGRVVRLVELRVAARRREPQLLDGTFWLDTETHAVVRAAFRLQARSAGAGVQVLSPDATAEIDVALEYGFWEMRWWLPRTLVARGAVRAMGGRIGFEYGRSYDGYRVTGDTLAPAPQRVAERPCRPEGFNVIGVRSGPRDPVERDSIWNEGWERATARVLSGDTTRGSDRPVCDRAFLVTRAPGVDLIRSPALPGGVYDAGEALASETELQQLRLLLDGIPGRPWHLAPPSLQLLPIDMLRYNRVEGMSLGARSVLPLGPAELHGELRAGTAGEPGGRFGVLHSGSVRAEAAAYRGLEAVAIASHPFTLTSSASALLLGGDGNDYFRASGAELRFSPRSVQRPRWDVRFFAERQEPVRVRSSLSLRGALDHDFEPRANLEAETLNQFGFTLRGRGALGDDPARLRTTMELELHGETGERSFARPLLRAGADRAFGPRFGAGISFATGAGFGELPVQRAWQVGGATTVRGHEPAAQRGENFWVARGELRLGPPLVRLAAFGDLGWAGARADVFDARPLRGVGVGVSLLDNLLRVDLARGGGGETRVYLRVSGTN